MNTCRIALIIIIVFAAISHALTFTRIAYPGVRSFACMVNDTANGQMVLFGGGRPEGEFYNDVWTLDIEAESWRRVEPSGTLPAGRIDPAAIYHAAGNEMLVFGGRDATTYFNDLWSLSLTPGAENWTLLDPTGTPPSPRLGAKAVVDPVNNRMIMFGGTTAGGGFDETWALDLGTYTWSLLNPTGSRPPARQAHCAIYDPVNHRLIIYAGSNWGQPIMNDLWVLDLTCGAESWRQLFPTGTQPGSRTQHFGVYDQCNHDLVMGFGYDAGTYDDIWTLDLNSLTWTMILPPYPFTVEARRASSVCCDPETHKIIIFGGNQWNYYYFADTYTLIPDSTGIAELQYPVDLTGNAIRLMKNPTRLPLSFSIAVVSRGNVSLNIADTAGRIVRTLIREFKETGNYAIDWDGTDDQGAKVAAGTYYIVLETNTDAAVRKTVLIE